MKIKKDELEKNTISKEEEHLIIAGETEIREEVFAVKNENLNENVFKENKTEKKNKTKKIA